tara:strand:- start:386 stop:790 length:405 start_codon:yes stop_codon:yes gene_type:complete
MIKKCGIILWNHSKEKIFLVYGKKSSKWGFPKGHMEENETEIQTAQREFYEETGYKLKCELNENYEKYIIRNNIYFIVKVHSEDDLLQETIIIPDQKEIEKSHWFSINELLSMDLSKFNFGLKTWILNKKYNSL